MENISRSTDLQIVMYQHLSTEKDSQMFTHLPSPLFLDALSAEVKLSLTVCSRGALSISIPLSFSPIADSTSPSYKNNTKQNPPSENITLIQLLTHSLTQERQIHTGSVKSQALSWDKLEIERKDRDYPICQQDQRWTKTGKNTEYHLLVLQVR